LTLRFAHTRFILPALLLLALAVLTACDSQSTSNATVTPIGPTVAGTATPRPAPPDLATPGATLPASPPTQTGGQVPQAVPTGAGQVPQPQLTGPAGQVPLPQPTGSPVLVTPGAVDPDNPPRVTLQELQELLKSSDTLLVDVRSAGNYEERHIKGAVSFPFTTIDLHVKDVPRDKLIIAYCQ
jgi:hypothetical protein